MKHKHFQIWAKGWLLGATITLALPAMVLAQAYGSGNYDQGTYGNGVLQIGPITLPNTGTTWVGIASLLIAATCLALLTWRRSQNKENAKAGQ